MTGPITTTKPMKTPATSTSTVATTTFVSLGSRHGVVLHRCNEALTVILESYTFIFKSSSQTHDLMRTRITLTITSLISSLYPRHNCRSSSGHNSYLVDLVRAEAPGAAEAFDPESDEDKDLLSVVSIKMTFQFLRYLMRLRMWAKELFLLGLLTATTKSEQRRGKRTRKSKPQLFTIIWIVGDGDEGSDVTSLVDTP
ncbi:hypothetical protein K435DRAFT_794400 [Dendrothele bispora CBS 962.96]|nr:hypothetical protein K435DRAFT_794400 [Dendrothele bispora CBS 962.96]